jgi:hypothetical protein
LLNVILHGNSILEGSGVSGGQTPRALIAAAKPTANVAEGLMGGDIVTLLSRVSTVTSQYMPGRLNIAVLLEACNYLADTRGEWGDGLTLSNPSAAAQACYDQSALWADAVIAAGFTPMAVTSPAFYETTSSPPSNNTQYNAARLALIALLKGNPAKFPLIADAAADARLQTPSDTTYYDGTQIHLTAAGYSVLALDAIVPALPPSL